MPFSPLDSELLGGLFATEAMREVFSDRHFLNGMLRVEAALARAQAALGMAPENLAPVLDAMDAANLDLAGLARGTTLSGVPVIPFVKMVQARLPADLESRFHLGTTTQDIADTALMLQVRAAIALIEEDLRATARNLADLAERHRETPCVGRTASQQAAPVTFGYKAAGWSVAVAEHLALLDALRARVLVASLGGPVGTLAAMGPRADELLTTFAAELGLGVPAISWHTQRGRIAELGSWLAILIGVLSKVATDVVALCATEVGEVTEPHEPGRGGSSAMPHKRNPISSMMILAAHNAASPHMVTLLGSMASLHERPVGAWHAEWHALPMLFGLASGASREARRLSAGLEIYPERMRRNLDLTGGLLFSDAAAGVLAKAIGRDQAHKSVEAAVSEVLTVGGVLKERLEARHPELAGELASAFDLTNATLAAAQRTDRAVAHARGLIAPLQSRDLQGG